MRGGGGWGGGHSRWLLIEEAEGALPTTPPQYPAPPLLCTSCSCDYLLPPVFADFFSLSSAQAMLEQVLPRWLAWHTELVNQQVLLRGGLGGMASDQFLWFKTDPVKVLPLLVS